MFFRWYNQPAEISLNADPDGNQGGSNDVDGSTYMHCAVCVCGITTLDGSASASRMDQTGSARSHPTSTAARCGKERKAQRPEKVVYLTRIRPSWISSPWGKSDADPCFGGGPARPVDLNTFRPR
eukprot:350149-Chlamydomonas_euryale.AAC.12